MVLNKLNKIYKNKEYPCSVLSLYDTRLFLVFHTHSLIVYIIINIKYSLLTKGLSYSLQCVTFVI